MKTRCGQSIWQRSGSRYRRPFDKAKNAIFRNKAKMSEFIYEKFWAKLPSAAPKSLRAVLYTPVKSHNDNLSRRLCFKWQIQVVGWLIIAFSIICMFFCMLHSSPLIAQYPALLALDNIYPVWISLFLFGTWIVCSRPNADGSHGIVEKANNLERHLLNASRYRKCISTEYQLIVELLTILIRFNSKDVLWKDEEAAIRHMVEKLSYGHVHLPNDRYVKEVENSENVDEYFLMKEQFDRARDTLADILTIWSSRLGLNGQQFHMTFIADGSDKNDRMDKICEIGRALGVEDAINAYMKGVPLADLLA